MFLWEVSDQDTSTLASEIHDELRREIEQDVGPAGRRAFIVAARGTDGRLAGGLRGFTHWSWLYISHLWVRADVRSLGIGRELLAKAVDEARARGCKGLNVDTFSDRAAKFYVQNGFVELGRIADFPPGRSRIFLQMTLV